MLAYSSGNHAQAVALAARLLGSQATILMPDGRAAVEGRRDARLRRRGRHLRPLHARTATRSARRSRPSVGWSSCRPYDDPLIMAGAGTAALELLEDAGVVDTLVVPVGGGGLIAGWATIAKELGVRRVVGVEPAAGDDWQQSFAAGRARARSTCRARSPTGCRRTRPGELTWEVGSRLVDEIVTVTDEQIVEAMRFAFERLKLVVEPSGAVGIAACCTGSSHAPPDRRRHLRRERRRRPLRRAAAA